MKNVCAAAWLLAALAITIDAYAVEPTSASPGVAPSSLFVIDQHRTTVVERIVNEWGDRLVITGAGVTREQLRGMLFAMRADQLLAASLAGSITGLRDVLASALIASGFRRGQFRVRCHRGRRRRFFVVLARSAQTVLHPRVR